MSKSRLAVRSSFVVLLALAACSSKSSSSTAPATCDEFVAGAYAGVGVLADPESAPLVEYALAANDLTVIVADQSKKLAEACKDIAVHVGVDASDPAAAGKQGKDAAVAWCTLAAKGIDASAAVKNSRPITLADQPAMLVCTPDASVSKTCTTACKGATDCAAYCTVSAKARAACTPPQVLVSVPPMMGGLTQAQLDVVRALSMDLPALSTFVTVKANAAGAVTAAHDLGVQHVSMKDAAGTKQQACYAKIALAADAGAADLDALATAVAGVEASVTRAP